VSDDSFVRLALGAGLLALLIRASSDVGALAWAVVVPATGLWMAAWWEARTRGTGSRAVLYVSATALAAAAAIPIF
jgi:hypothetical protein